VEEVNDPLNCPSDTDRLAPLAVFDVSTKPTVPMLLTFEPRSLLMLFQVSPDVPIRAAPLTLMLVVCPKFTLTISPMVRAACVEAPDPMSDMTARAKTCLLFDFMIVWLISQ
jgi:hypothetical protein